MQVFDKDTFIDAFRVLGEGISSQK